MAENQYIVETKFTADTEEFKQGAQEVQNELDKMNDKLTETEEATEVATEGLEDFADEVLSNISIGKGWLFLLGTIINTFATEFYAALRRNKEEAAEINAAINTLNGTIEESGWAATASVRRFNELRESWEKLSPDEKIAQYSDYKDALHDLNVEVASLNDLENKLVNNADKVVDALVARAKITAVAQELANAENAKGVAETNLSPIKEKMAEIEENVELERKMAAVNPETPRTYRSQYEDLAKKAAPLEQEIRKSQAILDKLNPYYAQLQNTVKNLNAEVEKGSIDDLTNQLQNLEAQFKATGDETKRAELGDQIKGLKEQIAELNGEESPVGKLGEEIPPVLGSLDELNAKLKTAQENYGKAATDEMRGYYAAEIDGIEKAIAKINEKAQAQLIAREQERRNALGLNAPVAAGVNMQDLIGSNYGINIDPSGIGKLPTELAAERAHQAMVEANEAMQAEAERWNDTLNSMFGHAVADSISGGIEAITDAIMGVGDIDATSAVDAFLSPFADMSVRLGEMMVAMGVAESAFLSDFNPTQKIAAGVALIAIGKLYKSAVESAGKNTGSTATASGNSWTGGGALLATNNTPIQVEVTGVLSGQDIYLAGNNYQNNQHR